MIIYVIGMFEFYKNQAFIFEPSYTFNNSYGPKNSFYPLGNITPMTPDEIISRNYTIKSSTK